MTKYRIVYTRDELDAMRREGTAAFTRPAAAATPNGSYPLPPYTAPTSAPPSQLSTQHSALSTLEIAILAFFGGAIFGVLTLFTLLEITATIWR